MPTRGSVRTRRSALGAVLVYQPALLHRSEYGADSRVGLKALLEAA